jgi:hypothetical protein
MGSHVKSRHIAHHLCETEAHMEKSELVGCAPDDIRAFGHRLFRDADTTVARNYLRVGLTASLIGGAFAPDLLRLKNRRRLSSRP